MPLLVAAALSGSPAWAALCNQTGGGTPLGNAAANLGARQWCEMSVNFGGSYTSFWAGRDSCNPSTALLCASSSGTNNIVTYANSLPWDPVRRQLHYNSWSHGGGQQKHIFYNDATNTWDTTTPSPATYGHGYDHNTIDPATGDFFHRTYSSQRIYRWNGSQWSVYNENWGNVDCCASIEWFPERNSLMGILNVGPWKELPRGASSWTTVATPSRWGTAVAVGGVVMLFQDNGTAIRYNSNGTVTTGMQSAPCGGNSSSTPAGIAADHVGKKIVFHCSSGWWEYDPINNTKSAISNSMPPLTGTAADETADCINGGISTYGVIAYVCAFTGTSGNMYIYKHSGSAVVTPPPTPSSLRPQ